MLLRRRGVFLFFFFQTYNCLILRQVLRSNHNICLNLQTRLWASTSIGLSNLSHWITAHAQTYAISTIIPCDSLNVLNKYHPMVGAQWLSGRVLDSRPRGRGFEPHRRHCVVVLEQDTFILAYYWFNPGRPVPV